MHTQTYKMRTDTVVHAHGQCMTPALTCSTKLSVLGWSDETVVLFACEAVLVLGLFTACAEFVVPEPVRGVACAPGSNSMHA